MQERIQRALISVSDKSGIDGFARCLSQVGIELLSTGGTHRALEAAGIPVREVSDYTGFPEMLDGRVKTLHPRVHGGILHRRDVEAHREACGEHGIEPIDLVVVNLYPFEATVAREGVSREEAVEQIDIGGPSMIRAAAKNHRDVAVVVDPSDYGRVLDELEKGDGALSEQFRRELAAKAYALTARYDVAISGWLFDREHEDGHADSEYGESAALAGVKTLELRYGENPHQTAAFYRVPGEKEPSVAAAEVLNGKALSFNNLIDLDAALALAKEFDEPFVAVTKHNNPCGAAAAASSEEALEAAWAGDPLSAFGSVLAFTRPVNLASADFLVSENRFVEAIIAPSFDQDALELLTRKPRWGKSVRLLACGEYGPGSRAADRPEFRRVVGGFLLQGRDLEAEGIDELKVVSKAEPSTAERESMLFAARVCKHVKSNAIVLARGQRVLGVGAGQMSRVDSVRLALAKACAGGDASGAVLASDAFFPFPDGVENAIEGGVTAILQPGGSVRDDAVIAACDERGASMVFTGRRHFRH